MASAQTVTGNRLRLTDGPCVITSSNGSPDKIVFETCSTLTTASATNMTLGPTGDLVLGPTGDDVMPDQQYTINLGSLSNKYLTLHAAELWVETLVAQNTIATIGGRVVVAPTNILTRDLIASDFTGTYPTQTAVMCVKYNSFLLHVGGVELGSKIIMQSNGKFEAFTVLDTSAPTVTGSGDYCYSVYRNQDNTGTNDWYAGDASLDTGKFGTSSGFIDLYSIAGVTSGSGPTIAGNLRTGAGYVDWETRWAIGNLNGLYGYGATTFGAAFGTPSATNITVDATNGFRIRSGTTNKLVADTSGNLSVTGDLTIGTGSVFHTASASSLTTGDGIYFSGGATPTFRVGNPAGEYISWNGSTLTVNGRISVGTGRNLITNAECRVNTEGWSVATAPGTWGGTLSGPAVSFAPWILNGTYQGGTCYVTLSGTPTGITDVYYGTPGTGVFPVLAGSTYEASVYLGNHRFNYNTIAIRWLDSGGSLITQSGGNSCYEVHGAGGATLAGYCRSGVIAVAPTGAVAAFISINGVHHGTSPAGDNPYIFWTRAYFGEASPGQSGLTPWGAAGATIITPGLIQADAITSDKITAGTIVASDIAASTITADRLSVTELSAIAADIGNISGGELHIGGGYGSGGMDIDEDGYTSIFDLLVGDVVAEGEISSSENMYINGHIQTEGLTVTDLSGGGDQFVCVSNSGVFYASAVACN